MLIFLGQSLPRRPLARLLVRMFPISASCHNDFTRRAACIAELRYFNTLTFRVPSFQREQFNSGTVMALAASHPRLPVLRVANRAMSFRADRAKSA